MPGVVTGVPTGVYSHVTPSSWIGLWIHRHPEQDEAITQDESFTHIFNHWHYLQSPRKILEYQGSDFEVGDEKLNMRL